MTPHETPFLHKMELIQYNAALATNGTMTGTSTVKLYKEVCLETISACHWYMKLYLLYKLIN